MVFQICILVSDSTDAKLIRQSMLIPDVFIGMLIGGKFTYELVKENITRNLAGDLSMPKAVLNLLKSKRSVEVNGDTVNLTPREQQILSLVQTRGASNKVIAKMLDISESTVKLHIGKVLKKYRVKNRTQLAVFCKNK